MSLLVLQEGGKHGISRYRAGAISRKAKFCNAQPPSCAHASESHEWLAHMSCSFLQGHESSIVRVPMRQMRRSENHCESNAGFFSKGSECAFTRRGGRRRLEKLRGESTGGARTGARGLRENIDCGLPLFTTTQPHAFFKRIPFSFYLTQNSSISTPPH